MVQEKKLAYCKALVELNEIIKHMSLELQNKIPPEIQQEFIKNMDKEYHFTYDETVPLEEQNMMPETQGLLSVVYSNYLCSEEEKKKWREYDNFYRQEQNKKTNVEVKEIFPRKTESQSKGMLQERVEDPQTKEIFPENLQQKVDNTIDKETQQKRANSIQKDTMSQELAIIKEKSFFRKILNKLKSWFSKK